MLDWMTTESSPDRTWLPEDLHDRLSVRRERCGRTTWLKLAGVLNWRTADRFREELDEALLAPCRRVVVDLRGVKYVGGDMLRALYALHQHLTLAGAELRLVAPAGSRCARSMALTGLDAIIPTFSDPTHAWRHRPEPGLATDQASDRGRIPRAARSSTATSITRSLSQELPSS